MNNIEGMLFILIKYIQPILNIQRKSINLNVPRILEYNITKRLDKMKFS